jgi:large subunit ribosomal protein L1
LQAGKQELKSDSLGNVHIIIGKVSTSTEQLKVNFEALKQVILQNKPSGVKGTYPKSISVNATMGPGIKVEL